MRASATRPWSSTLPNSRSPKTRYVAFQIREHVRDPNALFADIVQAAKPSGLIFIGVSHVPSALTRIPNFLRNAPPHHLIWWAKSALLELASRAGAATESIENVPLGRVDSQVYWIERFSPIKCLDVHFRGGLKWHAATLTGISSAPRQARFLDFHPVRASPAPRKGPLRVATLLTILALVRLSLSSQ